MKFTNTLIYYVQFQVKEFEHINGYYSVPELIRKPVDPVKNELAPGEAKPSTVGETKPAIADGSTQSVNNTTTNEDNKEPEKDDKKTKDVS